ncbi:DUF1289 domain-containing protein [Roseomonas sp. BU-1]|uniref:DUF1289 domain-containing protein n=2 Tax=Falsiroseomonas selenitidurans TaxID=2716335 RepID=A0ABX1E123_9PROT|nr:DUF1289 domain-containing protein [Falsiroseomonas selenitidurans]
MTGSPCVGRCVLDPRIGLCTGCGRSGAEIGAWPGMSDPARAMLVAALPGRLARMTGAAPPRAGAMPVPGPAGRPAPPSDCAAPGSVATVPEDRT